MLGDPAAPIRVELYLDLICPFSRKMWAAVVEGKLNEKAGDKVCFIVNQVPQPWHPQGTYVHEAALAVKQAAPDKYFAFCTAVYAAFDAGRFKDDTTWDLSRAQIYEELLVIASANGVLATPHSVSSSRIRPDLCHSVIMSLIRLANSSSPNWTASPQGASSIVLRGIS